MHAETTVVVVPLSSLSRPSVVQAILDTVSTCMLDIVGMRTCDVSHLGSALSAHVPGGLVMDGDVVMVMVLKGGHVVTAWGDAVGPSDAVLAKRTDPSSLRARYLRWSKSEMKHERV